MWAAECQRLCLADYGSGGFEGIKGWLHLEGLLRGQLQSLAFHLYLARCRFLMMKARGRRHPWCFVDNFSLGILTRQGLYAGAGEVLP